MKTNDKGQWAGQVETNALPCALQVKSDTQILHGYAIKAGNVNITPFTDLALALATNQTPSEWFKTYQPLLETTLKTAVDNLSKQLKADGYVLPEKFDILTSKFEIGDAFDKVLDAFGDALAANKAMIADYAALVEKVKTGDVAALPDVQPVTPAPTTVTCASKNLPVGKLSDLASYSGDYKQSGAVVFSLNAATGKIVAKGTNADIKEVCGPNNQSNGTNFYVITDKGYVTLFKETSGKYLAESADFSGFDSEKGTTTTPPVTNTCESNGADDKLGFKNAPSDFCSFTKVSSTTVVQAFPANYEFYNADKKEWVRLYVNNGVVKGATISTDKMAWSCGALLSGATLDCTGITFKSGANADEFSFANTVLSPTLGVNTKALTVKNGLLIHMKNAAPVVPAPTTTFTFNDKACAVNKSNTSYNQCSAQVMADFTATVKNCSISKVGNTLTATQGNLVIKAELSSDDFDGVVFKDAKNFTLNVLTGTTDKGRSVHFEIKNGAPEGITAINSIEGGAMLCSATY